jgi:hypothetical protein
MQDHALVHHCLPNQTNVEQPTPIFFLKASTSPPPDASAWQHFAQQKFVNMCAEAADTSPPPPRHSTPSFQQQSSVRESLQEQLVCATLKPDSPAHSFCRSSQYLPSAWRSGYLSKDSSQNFPLTLQRWEFQAEIL